MFMLSSLPTTKKKLRKYFLGCITNLPTTKANGSEKIAKVRGHFTFNFYVLKQAARRRVCVPARLGISPAERQKHHAATASVCCAVPRHKAGRVCCRGSLGEPAFGLRPPPARPRRLDPAKTAARTRT